MDAAEELLAIEKIRAVKARYWRGVDTKDWDLLSDTVFAPDVVADFSDTGGGVYEGSGAVLDVLRRALEGRSTAHQGGQSEIAVTGAGIAEARWTFTDRLESPGMRLVGTGVYHDAYRKGSDGWRLTATRIERTVTRTERPGAERHIEALLYSYAERLDAGDLAGVAALFERGRILPVAGASDEIAVIGSHAVEAMYRSWVKLYEDGTPRTSHVITNPTVEVDHESGIGRATSRFTVLQQTDDLPLQPIIAGGYSDTFRHDEGVWRFETRTIDARLVGDVSRHVMRSLD